MNKLTLERSSEQGRDKKTENEFKQIFLGQFAAKRHWKSELILLNKWLDFNDLTQMITFYVNIAPIIKFTIINLI